MNTSWKSITKTADDNVFVLNNNPDNPNLEYISQLWLPLDLLDDITEESIENWEVDNIVHSNNKWRNSTYVIGSRNSRETFSYKPGVELSKREAFIKAIIRLKEIKLAKENKSALKIFTSSISKNWILWFRIVFINSKPFLIVNRRFNTKLEKKYDLDKILLCDALKESIQLLKELYWVENSIDANIAKRIGNAKHTYTKWPKIELDKPDDAATFSQWLEVHLKDFVSSRTANSIRNNPRTNADNDIKCTEETMKEALKNLMLWK
jgi:hypothetical protein